MSTDEQSIKWYKEKANKYTEHVRNPKDSVYHAYYEKPAMYALLPVLEDKIVLSLGCGPGEDSNYLKNKGAKTSIGIDLSSELLSNAREAYPECEFKEMNMEELQFDDSTFDFVYSSLAIHYIEDWSQTFREVFRVLKPGSHFLFSCNHPTSSSFQRIDENELSIAKLEVRHNKEAKTVEIAGAYFPRRKLFDSLGKNTVNTWHKPLSEIVSEAQLAGFVIDKIIEPLPIEELREVSQPIYTELSKIPGFIIFRLQKPSY